MGVILPLLLTGNVNCIGSGRHNIIIISDIPVIFRYYCVTPTLWTTDYRLQTIQTKY